jgi:hypothetical protein
MIRSLRNLRKAAFPFERPGEPGRSTQGIRAILCLTALATTAALLLSLVSCGRTGSPRADGSGSAAKSHDGNDPHRELCTDLIELQNAFRIPALTRTEQALRNDSKLYAEAGDAATAEKIRRLAGTVGRLKQALRTNRGLQGATSRMERDLSSLPKCRAGLGT